MILINEDAKEYLASQLIQTDKQILFLSLIGGGCAGFEYSWQPLFSNEYPFYGDEEKDLKIELSPDLFLIVDSTILDKLKGSSIELRKSIIGSHIEIENPQAKNTCGCGTSFSL